MAESRDSLVKSTLIQRIDTLAKERRSTITNFPQRQQLRDELVEFGEQFLDQEAFNRLIGIMRRGGVDLLTIPPLSKQKERPLKRKREESDAIPDEFLVRQIERLKREMDQVKGRISALEYQPHEAPSSNHLQLEVIRPFALPFQTKEQVDQVNELIKVDRDYYEALVARIRQVSIDKQGPKGYYGILNAIFDQDVMNNYHYQPNITTEIKAYGIVRKPMHYMPIFNDVLVDAFGPALDVNGVRNEVLHWLNKVRKVNRVRKSRVAKKKDASGGEEILLNVKNETEEYNYF